MQKTLNREKNKRYLKRFIKLLGGQEKVAQLFDVTQGAVSHWCRRGAIPIRVVPLMCELLNIKRKDIRPDIYTDDD